MHNTEAFKPAPGVNPQTISQAVRGGLQAHSVSGPYPAIVVGIGNGPSARYEVHLGETVVRADEGIKQAQDFAEIIFFAYQEGGWHGAQRIARALSRGFTEKFIISGDGYSFPVLVKPDADLDDTITVWRLDCRQRTQINGWLWGFEKA